MKRGNIYVLCNSLIMNNLIIRGGRKSEYDFAGELLLFVLY